MRFRSDVKILKNLGFGKVWEKYYKYRFYFNFPVEKWPAFEKELETINRSYFCERSAAIIWCIDHLPTTEESERIKEVFDVIVKKYEDDYNVHFKSVDDLEPIYAYIEKENPEHLEKAKELMPYASPFF